MVFCGVADASLACWQVRKLCAKKVGVEVAGEVLLLLCRQIVKGVLGYPVVGAIVGLSGVCGVAAVAPACS